MLYHIRNTKTFIITEAGSNHNRNLSQAFKLIEVAKEAGCDAVKFQTYSSEMLYVKGTRDPNTGADVSKMIKEIELPREWQKQLKKHADDQGIEFLSTPFDEAAVQELVDIGVKRLKIAGFEAIDPRVVKMVARTQLPLIISLGIGSNVETIDQILGWIIKENPKPDVTFLHCNNPTQPPLKISTFFKYQNCCNTKAPPLSRLAYQITHSVFWCLLLLLP